LLSGEERFMRLVRYAAVAVSAGSGLLAIAAISAAAPAIAASTAFASPGTAVAGQAVTFTVNCDQGLNAGGAAAVLDGSTLGLPSRIPMNAIGGSLFNFNITVTLPSGLQPGAYSPHIDCPGGVEGANANLQVTAGPRGGAATGDGTTTTTTNGTVAVAGLALAGAGVLAGGLALRRRNTPRPPG
jgi:hypothetical protein